MPLCTSKPPGVLRRGDPHDDREALTLRVITSARQRGGHWLRLSYDVAQWRGGRAFRVLSTNLSAALERSVCSTARDLDRLQSHLDWVQSGATLDPALWAADLDERAAPMALWKVPLDLSGLVWLRTVREEDVQLSVHLALRLPHDAALPLGALRRGHPWMLTFGERL